VGNLLLLISSLEYSGPARRLCLLARGLPRDGFRVRVGVLGTTSPWSESLRQAGVDIDVFGWKRLIDAEPFWTLRRRLKADRPDVVHAFGSAALRAIKLCGVRGMRVIASDLLRGGAPAPGWTVDRWLLRGPGRVLAFGAAEAQRYQQAGVPMEHIAPVTPGVDESNAAGEAVGWPEGRVLFCVGPMEVHKGYRDAVWAFDILHYLFDDLRLAFLGDGPDRDRVADFARAVGAASRVTFLGARPTVGPYLRRAAVVWVPSRTAGGVCATLEAMAAQRPVVATRVPELEEIVVEGETGFLVPPVDKAALARQTRLLLGEAALAERFGTAAKQRVQERFSVDRMVAECAAVYRQIAG
jgi:glycosyltransferase involved in cell wall biosynthesis